MRVCPYTCNTRDMRVCHYTCFATVQGWGPYPPHPLRDRSVPPTGQVRTPYGTSPSPLLQIKPLRPPTTEGSVTPHTFFETPQKQVFSRFVPSIGSCSQFCFILQPHRVAVPFPPTFASPWRSNPWRNNFVEGKIWNHPSKTTMT